VLCVGDSVGVFHRFCKIHRDHCRNYNIGRKVLLKDNLERYKHKICPSSHVCLLGLAAALLYMKRLTLFIKWFITAKLNRCKNM